MASWIALLRGINVGGKHLLPMKELVAMLEDLGCTNVRTYIQSGNVVFEKTNSTATQLAEQIGQSIFDGYGFEPRVLLLTVKELQNAATSNPFPEAEKVPKSLHLCFLATKPRSPDLDALDQVKAPSESYALVDKVFYLHAPDGIGRSKLSAQVEKRLGVDATGRNWRTVSKLLDLST